MARKGAPGEDERRSDASWSRPKLPRAVLSGDELQMASLLVRATATHELCEVTADLPACYEPARYSVFLDTRPSLSKRLIRHRRYLRGCVAVLCDDEAFRAGRPPFSWDVGASSEVYSSGRSPRGLI